MMKIKKGDNVKVLRGKDAGKSGEVLAVVKVERKNGNTQTKVVVRGANKVTRHQKPNALLNLPGGIVEVEKPMDVSNVMLIDSKSGKPTRVKFEKGTRVSVKSNTKI
jgi:large subunit ribosomal protein L24